MTPQPTDTQATGKATSAVTECVATCAAAGSTPDNPSGYSNETLATMGDAVNHRTVGPFRTIDEMCAYLDSGD